MALAMAISLCQAKRPSKRSGGQPKGDCKVTVDSLESLYQAGDPSYLTWDFSGAKCDSSQLYTAYYYQGIGFYFLSAWKESLYFLTAALNIHGPKDEEILYHLWNVDRKLDRYQEMERLTMELHQRFPSSLFLLEILDQWKGVKGTGVPSNGAWGFSSKAAWAHHNTYLDHVLTNRLSGETRQKSGVHLFRETGSATFKTQWDSRLLQSFQADVGGEYDRGGFSAEADWGVGYQSSDTSSYFVTNGTQSLLVDSSWNLAQGRVALGYSFTTQAGWNLGWNASLFQLSKDWRAVGISHSQSFLISDCILIAYADFQNHWIHPTGSPDNFNGDLNGMRSFSLNLTPYFTWGKHSLGAGPTYYVSRWHYAGLDFAGSTLDNTEWNHSITAAASYSYDLRSWCRLGGDFTYGYEFTDSLTARKYSRKDVWIAEAGFTLAY